VKKSLSNSFNFLVTFILMNFTFYVNSSLGLAVPPRVRFLQKWKKAKEAKSKEKEKLAQSMVEDLTEKLNKSSDSEVSVDEPELPHHPSFKKDSYNFHGKF